MTTKGLRIPTPKEQAEQAIADTAARYGISKDRVLVPCKKHEDIPRRHAVWLDLLCEYGWSSWKLGLKMKRNHSTILYGVRKAARARYGTPPKARLSDIREAYLASVRQSAPINPWESGSG